MIRINLLGIAKPKNRRPGQPPPPAIEIGDVGSPMVKILVAVLVVAAVNGYQWYYLNHRAQVIATQMAQAEDENHKLADVKAKFLEHQKEADSYKRRVDVIDQLRAAQAHASPVDLLNTIGDTVNGTEAVWLSTMKDQGTNIAIEGTALSTDAVANLIANLQKTGYFKNIEIKETFQDEQVKSMQAFQFTLTCEKGKS
jgi:Tfp pilus assembly protein PilN